MIVLLSLLQWVTAMVTVIVIAMTIITKLKPTEAF
jgi:hypothetical protein